MSERDDIIEAAINEMMADNPQMDPDQLRRAFRASVTAAAPVRLRGRPAKPIEEQRQKLNLYLTPDELAMLNRQRGTIPQAIYARNLLVQALQQKEKTTVDKLEWNQSTGNYEGRWNGRAVIVSGDVMSETQNTESRERFGVDYADADAEQTAVVDRECLDPFAWVDTDGNQATVFDSVTDGMKKALVTALVADSDVKPRWTTAAAWQAAEDPDNWEEAADGTVRPNVIATSDQYD